MNDEESRIDPEVSRDRVAERAYENCTARAVARMVTTSSTGYKPKPNSRGL